MSLASGLSILFIFSKTQLLALLMFAIVCFVSFAFISARFYSFFPSTYPGFLPFLVSLGVELGYLFYFSPVSWGRLVLLWTFPLALLLQCPIGLGLLCFHFHLFLCIFWFLFYFFCDLLVNQKCVVQPLYVGIFNIVSPAINI